MSFMRSLLTHTLLIVLSTSLTTSLTMLMIGDLKTSKTIIDYAQCAIVFILAINYFHNEWIVESGNDQIVESDNYQEDEPEDEEGTTTINLKKRTVTFSMKNNRVSGGSSIHQSFKSLDSDNYNK